MMDEASEPWCTDDSSDSSVETLLGQVAGEYFEQMTGGEAPDIEDFARRYPEIAEQIRCAFPALQAVGQTRQEEPSQPGPLAHDKRLGDFRIVGELGRGGMGVVYEAEQLSLGRQVALKVLMFAALAQEHSLQRFRNEVRAAGALHHPNIVPIHAVGEEQGVHYFAMQLIRGRTLAEVIAQLVVMQAAGQSLNGSSISKSISVDEADDRSWQSGRANTRDTHVNVSTVASDERRSAFARAVARLGVQAAEALQHAHESGVLHRDIKPGNLMLDAEGQLYITDFGLARMEADVGITMTGDLVGTLRYMSPEQALAKRTVIDHRSDIYSLGATLYELLTLRPPLDGASRQELLKQIAVEDPPKLRQINPSVPRELETIVLKAIEKEPEDRYETANELADDLRAFLEDRPIKAKAPTFVQRAAKWSRRHRSLVAAAVVVLLMATLGLGLSTLIVLRQKTQTSNALKTARTSFNQSESYRRQAEQAVDMTERLLYVRNLSLAAQAYRDGDTRKAADLLTTNPAYRSRPELRAFEWHYLCRLALPEHTRLTVGRPEIRAARYSPDDQRIAIGFADGSVEWWDSETRQVAKHFHGHNEPITQIDLDPRGSLLATGSSDGTVRIWSFASDQPLAVIPANPDGEVFDVRFSPDGGILATAGDDKLVRVWSTSDWSLKAILQGHEKEVRCLAFLPDGTTLASGSNDDTIKLWDVDSKRLLTTLEGHTGFVLCLDVTSDGKLISGANDATARVWDLKARRTIATIAGHLDGIQSLAVLDKGQRLVTGDRGGTVRVWNLDELDRGGNAGDAYLQGHADRVWSIDAASDSSQILTAGRDGSARIWLAPRREASLQAAYRGRKIEDFQFTGNGSSLAILDEDELVFWDSRSGEKTRSPPVRGEQENLRLCVSPDEMMYAIAYWDGPVALFRVGEDRVRVFPAHNSAEGSADQLLFTPDGSRLITACNFTNQICVWDIDSGKLLTEFPATEDCMALSPKGNELVVVDYSDCLVVGTENWHLQRRLSGHSITITDVQFNAQGTMLASCSEDRKIVLWDTDSWTVRHVINAHLSRVESVAFTPDGRTLASGAIDGTIKLWNVELAQELFELPRQASPVVKLQFSPDGQQLVGKLKNRDFVVFEIPSS